MATKAEARAEAEGVNECAYCGVMVGDGDVVPPVDDDGSWERLAAEHGDGCEWVETRAHRLTARDQQLDWTESGLEEIPEESAVTAGRLLAVCDEVTCFRAELPDGMSVDEALADYVLGYDGGDDTDFVVTWNLYQGGEQLDSGRHEWAA